MMYFSPRKLLLFHDTTALVVKTIATCPCYILCAPNCTAIALDGKDLFPPPSPPPPPATQKSNNMSMLLILMLSILGAAFLCLCYFTMMKRYRSNLSTSRRVFLSIFSDANGEGFADENHGPVLDHPIWYIQTVGLQESVIDSIPVFKYKKGDGLVEGSDCSVCLSEFEDDESLRLLPKCSHAFHISCIDTWLRSHKNCPLCRAPIVPDESSLSVDPIPASEDAVVGDDEQVNDGNGEARISELINEGPGIGSSLDGHGKVYGTNGVRVLSDLGDHRTRTEEELQAVRRSFSMDLGSASRIYGHVAKIQPIHEEGSSSLEDHAEGLKKPNSSVNRSSRKSFSFGRSLQSVPIRMKRSFSSSSGKSSVSRSQEMV